jgi:predicted dehydrogenase
LRLLWHDSWIDAPDYFVPDEGASVAVEATVALFRIENASNRISRQPGRKVAIFLMTDGPRSTLRKARTKRREPRYSGDLHTAVVLGSLTNGRRVVALAIRVPKIAQQVVVHQGLVRDVPESFSADELGAISSKLLGSQHLLEPLTRQNYLYSGAQPPEELRTIWLQAFDRGVSSGLAIPSILIAPEPMRTPDLMLPVAKSRPSRAMPVALLGAGDHARTEIIPALRKAGLSLRTVSDREPQIAATVAAESGFEYATTDSERAVTELPRPGLVVVATAHDSHARLATLAATLGHRVFVEKPPTVTHADVLELRDAMVRYPGAIEIGYNRRYHPLVNRARAALAAEPGPTSIVCTVKELPFEPDHWYFWPNQGTRFTGNLCHWIDLAVYFLEGSPQPSSITLTPPVSGSKTLDEERVLTATFNDGSLFTILGTTRGDHIRGVQEQIEIRRGGTTVMIDDLWKMRVRCGGIERPSRTVFRNKAHGRMYEEALGRFERNEPAVYPVRDMLIVSAIQVAVSEMVGRSTREAEIPCWLEPSLQLGNAETVHGPGGRS